MSIDETAVVGLACSWADSSRRGEPSGLEGRRGGSGGGGEGDCVGGCVGVGVVFEVASLIVAVTGGAASPSSLGSAIVILQRRAVIAPPRKAAMCVRYKCNVISWRRDDCSVLCNPVFCNPVGVGCVGRVRGGDVWQKARLQD